MLALTGIRRLVAQIKAIENDDLPSIGGPVARSTAWDSLDHQSSEAIMEGPEYSYEVFPVWYKCEGETTIDFARLRSFGSLERAGDR